MCWYSVEHSGQQMLKAETGERLGVRKMYGGTCWVVREYDLKMNRPSPRVPTRWNSCPVPFQ